MKHTTNHANQQVNVELLSTSEVMAYLATNEGSIPLGDQNFYRSVKKQYLDRGISEKQVFWMRKFATRLASETSVLDTTVNKPGNLEKKANSYQQYHFERIVTIISSALDRGIKYPKIKLSCADKVEYTIYWSDYFSIVSVKVGISFLLSIGKDGRIAKLAGDLFPNKDHMLQHLHCIQQFNDNPEQAAKLFGQLTGNCCFCGKELSTKESLAVGYGPTCAEHFSLPWGDDKVENTVKEDIGSSGSLGSLASLDLLDDIPF